MSLTAQAIALALCMSLFSALPLFLPAMRRHSTPLLMVGTGAMFGICFFDLLPDVYKMGGASALSLSAAAWLAYSGVHSLRFLEPGSAKRAGDAHAQVHSHEEAHGFYFFLGPLVAHGFASGMMLTVSRDISESMGESVFVALFAHKAYEALLLATVLVGMRRTLPWKLRVVALFASAPPAGASLAMVFHSGITHGAAILISAIAVGTLLGCLIFDFLAPSLKLLRASKGQAAWLLVGFALTRVIMSRL